MEQNGYMKKALSDLAFDVSFGDSIRHLHNSGYTPEEIVKYFDTSTLTEDKVREVIAKYESSSGKKDGGYEFVKVYDEFGKASFVKRRIRLTE
ncbi:MAG: hypothetical protein K6F34_09415 [Lachnospiraceae bacterium]|nr:hypothetical protein [Lachnospiraceae bacterium]